MTEPHLTPRQQQVRDMLVHGHCNKEVARDLDISIRTVEDHRAAVLRKMDVENVAELVLKFYGLGKFAAVTEAINDPALAG
jgi:FixJ family two-component response regulator